MLVALRNDSICSCDQTDFALIFKSMSRVKISLRTECSRAWRYYSGRAIIKLSSSNTILRAFIGRHKIR